MTTEEDAAEHVQQQERMSTIKTHRTSVETAAGRADTQEQKKTATTCQTRDCCWVGTQLNAKDNSPNRASQTSLTRTACHW